MSAGGDGEKAPSTAFANEKISVNGQQLPGQLEKGQNRGDDSVSLQSVAPSIAIPEASLATTRWELWSYYLYYVGNNGLAGFNFGPSAFQNLLYLAATCDANNRCTLPFAGSNKSGWSSNVRDYFRSLAHHDRLTSYWLCPGRQWNIFLNPSEPLGSYLCRGSRLSIL